MKEIENSIVNVPLSPAKLIDSMFKIVCFRAEQLIPQFAETKDPSISFRLCTGR